MLRTMPKLFDEAVAAVRKLPPDQQESIGAIILEEIRDEARWAAKFAATRDKLQKLADEAIEEFRAGRTTPLEFPKGE